MSGNAIVYCIDSENRIDRVSENWNTFARANDAPELVDTAVVGRPLFSYITDAETRHLVHLLIARVRAGHAISVPFRCDAPDRRRRMRLTMTAAGDGHVLFHSAVVSEEPRAPQALLDVHYARRPEWLKICSWCKRVEIDDDWVEVDEAVSRRELLGSNAPPQITHGICPPCRDVVMQEGSP
jgi:hypothetical protein